MWDIVAAKTRGTNDIGFIDFTLWCETEEEAIAALTAFPKYVRVRKIRGSGPGAACSVLSFRIDFTAQKDNPKNETGVKRLRKALEVIGANYKMGADFSNAATMEEVRDLID